MRSHDLRLNFLSGVLDPRAAARIDTAAYNNGLLVGLNVVPHHLGGLRRRPGTLKLDKAPRQLTLLSATPTAPNGGTAANATDDDETTLVTTTSTVGTTTPFVVAHLDLGSAKQVDFADCIGIVSDGGASTEFCIQYSTDDSTWTNIQGGFFEAVDTTARSYRFRGPIPARYWRVAKIGGTDMGSVHVSIAGFNLWQESATVSAGHVVTWEVSTSEQYKAVFTDRTIHIYGTDDALLARVPSPYVSADIDAIDAATNAETMIIVHEDYPQRALIRETITNFQSYLLDFDSVPEADFGDADSPAVTADVQVITFGSAIKVGETFQISLDGARTGPIVYSGDNATTAANIAREVQKLWTVQAFTGVSCARTGTRVFTVTLDEGSADAYGNMTVSKVTASDDGTVSHSVTGVSRREPVWSETRGYPGTVLFFEGRMYFGGTRSKQQSIMGSRVNSILEFEVGEGLDDDPIFSTLNGSQLNAVVGLFAGRSMQMFTTGGEFRFVKEQGAPVTPADSPVNQTQYGAAKIRPVSIDGATVFVQRNRRSVRDFRFDYTENAYNSLGVSSLAAHLIYDVRDLAAWNGSRLDEIGLVLVVNGVNPSTDADAFPEGTIAVFNTRKEANVQAWTIWQTDGKFRSVATVQEGIYFLVERTINGETDLFFEKASYSAYTDCATMITHSPASTAITGVDYLDGAECRVRGDGFVLENVTPSGGVATASQAAAAIEVGLDWTTNVTPMPLQTLTPVGSNLFRKRRVVRVRVKVRNTLGLMMNGRPLPDRFWDQDSFDEAAAPFTGVHEIEETTNWDQKQDKIVAFTQTDPLPLEILGIDVQLESAE